MVANASLAAQKRTGSGKSLVRKLRAAGRTPAVIYGHGETTSHISLDSHELGVLFSHISVENTIINIKVDKAPEIRALVREVQVHPSSRRILHVDFYQIHAGERLEVEVPLHFVGASAGVKAGGILHPNFNSLPIRCLAENIPAAIEVDVSALDIGDTLHTNQLTLPEGVTTELDPEAVICSVTPPTVVAAEVPAEAAEAAEAAAAAGEVPEPEVIRRRAAEEGEES